MKMMKKLATIILSVCLLVPCFSMLAYAADGTLQFTDPDATQGKTVEAEGVVRSGGSAIGDVSVTMTYDAGALEFVSGDNVSGGNGTITYSATGNGSESEIRFSMKFNVLTAGTSVITAAESSATLSSGEALNLTLGTSTVTAAEGDGTTAYETPAGGDAATGDTSAAEGTSKITVNGNEYDFSEGFTQIEIPDGFEETTLPFEGADRKFVSNVNSGITLGYLVDAAGTGSFFLYDADTATFYPYVALYISDTTTIVLLSDVSGVSLPEQYQTMQLTVNDSVFPAWQDMNNDGYYVLYALDASGNKTLYQYDNTDGTYQRFIKPEEEKEDTSVLSGILGKVQDFVQKNFLLVALLAAVVIVLILILLITLGVKLHHRNRELDDLYDEYDIPDEIEDEKSKKKIKEQPNKKGKNAKDKDLDYEDDEYFDDEYDDDEYYDDDDDYYVDDDDDDDFEVEYEESNAPKRSKGSVKKKDEDYDIDFIDI